MSLAVSLQYLFPKRALTEFGGWVANGRWGAITQWIIRRFIRKYGVNMAEAANPDPTAYGNFNERMAIDHHWEVLDALKRRDGAAARAAICRDILDGNEKMLEYIEMAQAD